MTEPAPPIDQVVVRRHPVIRLLAVLALLLAAFGAVAWSGAINPRVTVRSTGIDGEHDQTTGWAYASVEIVNDGSFTAEIEAIEVRRPAGGATEAALVSLRAADAPGTDRAYPTDPTALDAMADLESFRPFELAAGTSREIVALYEVRCPGDWPEDIIITARSALGRAEVAHLSGPPLGSWTTPTAC